MADTNGENRANERGSRRRRISEAALARHRQKQARQSNARRDRLQMQAEELRRWKESGADPATHPLLDHCAARSRGGPAGADSGTDPHGPRMPPPTGDQAEPPRKLWVPAVRSRGDLLLLNEIPGVETHRPVRLKWFDQLLTTSPDEIADDRFFFVGVDAGTSGIRVALHDEFHSTTSLHAFGPNDGGGTRFSFPAVAGCDGEVLVLGNDAIGLAPPHRFVSFKGAMLHRQFELDLCARWRRLRLPYFQELCTEWSPSVADFLYSVSIARALELALPELVPQAGSRDAYLGFAIGAPFTGDDPIKRRFERGFAAALLLAGSIGNRPPIARLVEHYAYAWEAGRQFADAPPETRRINVRSEAHCAILPLRRLFQVGRNFLIADIGAATTDISVVRIGSEQRPFCYATASAPVGVDTLDLLATSKSRTGEDVLSQRIYRSMNTSRPVRPQRHSFADREAEALEPLRRVIGSVLHEAILKNDDKRGWRNLHMIIVGGGSQVPWLKAVVAQADSAHRYVQQRQALGVLLDPPHSAAGAPRKDEEYELVSVLGCAVPEWEVGEYGTPDQVPRVRPTYWSLERRR
jgi:hypothetical protein